MKSLPRDTPFPSGIASFITDPQGGAEHQRLKTSLSAPNSAASSGVPRRAGAAVTQEAVGAQVPAPGEGADIPAVPANQEARCLGSGVGGGPQVSAGAGAAQRGPQFPANARSPQGSPGSPARPAFPPPAPRPCRADSSAAHTRLRRRPGSSSPGPAALPAAPVAGPLFACGGGAGGGASPALAAVMLLRLPPLRADGQLAVAVAVAGAGAGARWSLARTPPSPALGFRGRRGAPGPGAA